MVGFSFVIVPRFDGARAKVDRALEHLQLLDVELQLTFKSHAYGIGGKYKPETAEICLYALGADFPLLDWGVRVGDCVHNLRSALDHVVWQLALCHLQRDPTEKEARRIQFPISDSCNGFKASSVKQYISCEHFSALDQFQPYKAGEEAWRHKLAILRELSNTDKHRVIHAAAVIPAKFEFEFTENSGVVSYGKVELFHGQPLHDHACIGRISDVVVSRADPKMEAHGPFSVGVVFDDPDDPALHQESVTHLIGQVGATVNDVVTWFVNEFAPAG
jgi:hypothetical protein